jgi:glycosyltransferase involved in cell wall biosynthesis
VSDRPLRVLAVTNLYPSPRDPVFGIFVQRQMQAVQRSGVSVSYEIIDGRASSWNYVTAYRRVTRLARPGAFDVVHAHYGLSGFVAAGQPLPLVVSFCGDDLNGSSNGRGGITAKSRITRQLSFLAAYRADAIICKSAALRDRLPRVRDRERAHVIPNGVDTTVFHPGDRTAARGRLGVGSDEHLVLFPHAVTQRAVKRFDLAEAAVERLHAEGMNVRLWVVAGVPPRDMPDYYRAADCLLLTSDHEGSPNVVKEAIVCDVPVVSVDAGDVTRWMALAAGCRVVAREPGDIARGIAEVLAGPRRVDGSRVRNEIREDAVAAKIVAIYEEVIQARASRSR